MFWIEPPPAPPYWPAYPEPKRSQMKVAHEREVAAWQKRFHRGMLINSILPLAVTVAIAVGCAIFVFGILPAAIALG